DCVRSTTGRRDCVPPMTGRRGSVPPTSARRDSVPPTTGRSGSARPRTGRSGHGPVPAAPGWSARPSHPCGSAGAAGRCSCCCGSPPRRSCWPSPSPASSRSPPPHPSRPALRRRSRWRRGRRCGASPSGSRRPATRGWWSPRSAGSTRWAPTAHGPARSCCSAPR
ncbi:MAG: hypothetical protein AVDCRST_MAG41-4074, partial [uncultured Corynebacteriales bacterium]